MTAGVAVALLLAAQAPTTRVVGAGAPYATVSEALAAAHAGDTIRVTAGVYRERPAVYTPVVLVGEEGAVLDGGGTGTVLTIRATATVRGLTVRGSGAELHREDAGILAVDADGVVIEGNRLEDVLFGIYVKQSRVPRIRDNTVVGKALPLPLRGDGIRLWYSPDGLIEGNRVRRARDVVIWFSDRLTVRDNVVRDSRYGLHYMYSHHSRFEENEFVRNHVGAFLMYSREIEFRRNVFAEAAGASGMGLGLKDADAIVAVGNAFVKNAIGIHLDNSPSRVDVTNEFTGNVIAFNHVGVSPLASVRANRFTDNIFLDNLHPVAVPGGGTATANDWRGNAWSEYAGFDEDGNGRGDLPFVYERWSDDLLAKHPALRWYELSPAVTALNVLGRFFPLLQPQPIVVDSAPRLQARLPELARGGAEREPATAAAAAFLLLSAGAGAAVLRLRRPFRRRQRPG